MAKKKPLVMVVEDEPYQAEDFANIIRDTGEYDVIVAHNGKDALKKIKQNRRFLGFARNRIASIVLDIRMPEMDGMEFLRRIRSQEKHQGWFRHIPVVLLTAYDEEHYWRQAAHPEMGMVAAYLTKPLNKPDELTYVLHRLISCRDMEVLMDKVHEEYRLKDIYSDYLGSADTV